ncbi:MAG: hypothetical protein OIF57_02305 [Marinobacterium sp.]|nr:hypothetical protein [Marinobacterium sp.]
MRRYYYLCDDLDELETIEKELEQDGFSHRSIQVLSRDAAGAEHHHLHTLPSLLQLDTFWYALRGLAVGLLLVFLLSLLAWQANLHTLLGLGPLLLLALLITLFCSWEGGFVGFQTFNHRLRRFLPELRKGRHLLLIDIPDERLHRLQQHMRAHPHLYPAGDEQTFLNPFT